MKKPEIVFLTPIYHLNVVYSTGKFQPLGHICLSSLNDWRPEYTLKKILPEIFALFNKNNPDSSYDDFQNRAVYSLNHAKDLENAINVVKLFQFCLKEWNKIEKT